MLPRARSSRSKLAHAHMHVAVNYGGPSSTCCAHEHALTTGNAKGYVRTHVLRLGECSFLWWGQKSSSIYSKIPQPYYALASRSHAFSIRDIATRAGEGLVHCLQATCSPLQEFLHSQLDCRILPRDVIPPTRFGAASSSAWFRLTF